MDSDFKVQEFDQSEDCSTVSPSELKKNLRLWSQLHHRETYYLERGRDTELETNEEKPREQKD